MTKKILSAVVLSLISLSISAQDSVEVGGDISVKGTVIGDQIAIANGNNTEAIAKVGVVDDANVSGNATVSGTVTGDQVVIVEGDGTKAKSCIGTVGGC